MPHCRESAILCAGDENMKYIELSIETTESGMEIVTAKLMAMGIDDIRVDDPADVREMLANKALTEYTEPGAFDDVLEEPPSITVYFDDDASGRMNVERVRTEMKELAEAVDRGEYGNNVDLGTLVVKTGISDDADWKDRWKEYLEPVHIGSSIVVRPSWTSYMPGEGETVIEIDPGMAFGTGTHATTMLSGNMLSRYMKKGDRVMDVGCGTGILSIIAAKLGASEVLGIDIDTDAVEVAGQNIQKNGAGKAARAVYGDLAKGVEYRADVIVANLLAGLVMDLEGDAAKHLDKGGVYITSGILTEQERKVVESLEAHGFEVVETIKKGEWCGIAAKLV